MVKEKDNYYKPDNWVILRLKGNDPHYRVLAGWSGGYATGDSWRMNSGIVRHEFDGDYWYFYGSSGSCYMCYLDSYGLRMNNAYVWDQLKKRHGDKVELLEDQEWSKKDWDWILT
jgi:hypothetical protein